jgi:uncharacterized surface protein with fasciclin (FAS1) repeats
MRKFFVLSLLLVFSLVLAACAPAASEPVAEPQAAVEEDAQDAMEEKAEEMPKSIVEIAVENGSFSTLVTALQAAGLVETLQGDGPFTVFAPTDEAFAALPEGTLEALLADTDALTKILLYHVVDGKVMAADVAGLNGQEVATISGEEIQVQADDKGVMINDANVIITDIEGSNGVIHVVDAVILPPAEDDMSADMEEEAKSIVEIAVEDGRFSTLVAALQAAELVEALGGEGPFTVFAPTDDAFAALPEGALEGLLADPAALANVLLYHVVEGKVLAADVVGLDGQEVATLLGENIMVKANDMGVMINEAEVVITDIEGSNGVIHVIDAVILPPADDVASADADAMMDEAQTIVDIAVSDERFSTLVTALQEAELVEALQVEGPFTVFAPTDEAFAALPEGALEGLLADKAALTDVLLFHVIGGEILAADVVGLDGQMAETLSGFSFPIEIDGDKVMVGDAIVIITDIEASNGVIHVIDAVLLPSF